MRSAAPLPETPIAANRPNARRKNLPTPSAPQKRQIQRGRHVLLALLLPLLLTSCAGSASLGRPDKSRTEPVAYPSIAEGEAPCPHDPVQRCLSDSQNADLLRAYDAALTEANAKLLWLGDFFAGIFD